MEAAVRTPLPGMGGIYCLPISAEQPALASQPDLANDAWSPLVLTQENNSEVDDLADLPNEVLTTLEMVALFQPDHHEAQGTELGHGNTTGHNANDGALTGDNVSADLGTQATGASEYGDAPPDLSQFETVDEGNEGGEEEGGRGTVRVRDIEGEEDLARQFLHPCDNQLIAVYGDTLHRNDGRHLDGGIADDGVWQRRYDRVVAHPHPM